MLAGAALLMAGCATQPVFIPGIGAVFGTVDDQQGNTYKITQLSNNSVRVDAEGTEGDLTFIFDSAGNLTNITAADGTNISFTHQANGTVNVSGIGVFDGTQFPIGFSFTPGSSSSAKLKNDANADGDPFIVCLIIDLFCDSLEDLITDFLPPMIDEFINDNLPAIIAEFNKQSFIPIPQGVITQFPTGIENLDDFIREKARERVDPLIAQARNFCAHWQLLRLLEISACDAVGS